MSATSKTDLLSQIDKQHHKYKRISQINSILSDDSHLSKAQQVNVLAEIVKELLDEQGKAERMHKQQQ